LAGWIKARWYQFLGRLRLRSHQTTLALEVFRKVAEQKPSDLHIAIQIGWCLYKLEDYQASIDKYEWALQQRPDYASAHASLALALGPVHRYEEAIDEVRRSIRISPNIKNRAFWE
jgi:tetratricopeptide (TPR) repeat protein